MNIDELALVYKALSVPSRLRILKLISDKALCVNAITRFLDISQPAVSQHLGILKKAGLVTGDGEGTFVHYRLNASKLAEFKQAIADEMGDEFIRLA